MAMPRKSSLDSEITLSGEYSVDAEVKRKLEQVDERLSCAVCLGRFEDPRMLDCRHSFCRKCLVDVVTKRLWDPQYPVGGCLGYLSFLNPIVMLTVSY